MSQIDKINVNGVDYDIGGSGGGHTMTPIPSSSVDESDVVDAVISAVAIDGGSNNEVASLFGIGSWSNTMTKTYVVTGSTHVGTSGIGTWPADPQNPTSAEYSTWIEVPLLKGCSANTGLDIDLGFDPATVSTPITLGGYVIDDNYDTGVSDPDHAGQTIHTAMMCIKFGNEIPSADTSTAKIYIELTIKRNNNEIAVS